MRRLAETYRAVRRNQKFNRICKRKFIPQKYIEPKNLKSPRGSLTWPKYSENLLRTNSRHPQKLFPKAFRP